MDSHAPQSDVQNLGAGTDIKHPGFVFSAMIAIDASALSLWFADWISTVQLFSLHVLAMCLLFGLAVLFNRRATLPVLIETSFCILAGPLGTLVFQIGRLGQMRPVTQLDALDGAEGDLSKPLSVSDAIHEMHLQGRRSKPRDAEDQTYADIIRHGDLLRQNEIIAAISRNYKPEMYPALSLALGSHSPALKVQAAAVFSKLRRTLGDAANDLLAINVTLLTPETAKDCHDRLLNVARSGFVDAAKAQALTERAGEIVSLGLHVDALSSPPKQDALQARQIRRDMRRQGPRLKRYSCGGLG